MARTKHKPLLRRLRDGTVKQVNPFTGMLVWTVPGRANRPIAPDTGPPQPIDPSLAGRYCAFCERRYLDTTPERARLVVGTDGEWELVSGLRAEDLNDSVAQFRIVPNLFEIVTLDYWRINHRYRLPESVIARRDDYLSTPLGEEHVQRVLTLHAAGEQPPGAAGTAYPREDADFLFGGFHDVVIARRHFVDGASHTHELAGSGTLTPQEHRHYVALTAQAMTRLYAADRRVRNVAVFQNWLRPAGASFDHLHKQLVALDAHGQRLAHDIQLVTDDPTFFDRAGIGLARQHGLVVAENEHAVAFAGIGHRYPALEVWMRHASDPPWELPREQLDGWADLLHACHAATGATVPTNEEWHHRPPGLDGRLPLRAVLKWRVSTLAGFEGGTDIALNTVDPWRVRDRTRGELRRLEEAGALAPGLTLA